MKKIINKGRRRLGIPGRPALILNADEAQPITENQIEEIRKNRTVANWLERGVLLIVNDGEEPEQFEKVDPAPRPKRRNHPKLDIRQPEVLPEGITGEGTEFHHLGGGWYQVYVNGFKVTDSNVRKADAETIAVERSGNDVGTVCVHFPRAGYRVSPL